MLLHVCVNERLQTLTTQTPTIGYHCRHHQHHHRHHHQHHQHQHYHHSLSLCLSVSLLWLSLDSRSVCLVVCLSVPLSLSLSDCLSLSLGHSRSLTLSRSLSLVSLGLSLCVSRSLSVSLSVSRLLCLSRLSLGSLARSVSLALSLVRQFVSSVDSSFTVSAALISPCRFSATPNASKNPLDFEIEVCSQHEKSDTNDIIGIIDNMVNFQTVYNGILTGPQISSILRWCWLV